ncbi:MAG: hypothetical protein ACJAXL_001594 [Alphaproteobacteria bacterium]|jgi:hypothetical protein
MILEVLSIKCVGPFKVFYQNTHKQCVTLIVFLA